MGFVFLRRSCSAAPNVVHAPTASSDFILCLASFSLVDYLFKPLDIKCLSRGPVDRYFAKCEIYCVVLVVKYRTDQPLSCTILFQFVQCFTVC